MASMREMAKKNLEKMVKGAAREVNTSRPARDGRSGASAAPAPAKKATAEAPAKTASAPEAAAPAKPATSTETAAPAKAGASTESAAPAKAGASTESAAPAKAGASTESAAPAKAGASAESAAPAKAGASAESAASTKAGAVSDAGSAHASAKAGAGAEAAATTGKDDSASIAAASSAKVGAPSEAATSARNSTEAAKISAASAADTDMPSGKAGAGTTSSAKASGTRASSGASAPDIEMSSGRASVETSSVKTTSAADIASSSAKAPVVPASVFEQLQAQIQKNGKTIQKVPVDSIKLNENIREAYNDEHLKTLADSMQKDGLIQFPTLCLKAGANGEFTFVCKNGHRRILAAKSLGWKTIECVILPFASTRDELYHTIAANLREDVFYLDLAQAYQQANHLGESDQAIAERVGVNPRTVGWYRRLTTMPPECQALCRQYPDLFHATWAIQLARKGELPPLAVLMKQMQFMLVRYQALKNSAEQAPQPDRLPKTIDVEQQKEAKASLKSLFSGARGSTEAQQAWQLVEQLCIAGYFKPALLNRMRRQLLSGAQKSSRRASTVES